MERVFRVTADLACLWEDEILPEGTLALEPVCTGSGELGSDWVFLASRDGGATWREYRTVMSNPSDWFELVKEPRDPSNE